MHHERKRGYSGLTARWRWRVTSDLQAVKARLLLGARCDLPRRMESCGESDDCCYCQENQAEGSAELSGPGLAHQPCMQISGTNDAGCSMQAAPVPAASFDPTFVRPVGGPEIRLYE